MQETLNAKIEKSRPYPIFWAAGGAIHVVVGTGWMYHGIRYANSGGTEFDSVFSTAFYLLSAAYFVRAWRLYKKQQP